MQPIFDVLAGVVELYVFVLVARALLSWFPVRHGSPLERVNEVLSLVTEPVLAPIRRMLPPIRAGGMGIDLSLMIVVLVAQVILIPFLRG